MINITLENKRDISRLDHERMEFGELIEHLILIYVPNRNVLFTWNNKGVRIIGYRSS
jgi:hypothetical protein